MVNVVHVYIFYVQSEIGFFYVTAAEQIKIFWFINTIKQRAHEVKSEAYLSELP